MSGAEVFVVGAVDERVKAVIAQVPACGDDLPRKVIQAALESAMQGKTVNLEQSKVF